ncbi:hypothetical protein ACLB2K_002836 [Fragaria x ananassa]
MHCSVAVKTSDTESIKYKKGKNNAAPDVLSKSVALQAITCTSSPIYEFLKETQHACLTNPQPGVIKEEPPAGHLFFADKDSHVPGHDSTLIKKPLVVGEYPTENDKKPLSRCRLCGKITDHGLFDCPDTEKVRKLFAYCKVCNMAGHDFSDCPKATEDVLKKLAYCMICRKNTDHNTFHRPKENGWVM